MEMNIESKIERWRIKAELFLKNDTSCFLKTLDGSYHSADILLVGEDTLLIYDFIKNQKFKIYWIDVTFFEEYEVRDKGVEE